MQHRGEKIEELFHTHTMNFTFHIHCTYTSYAVVHSGGQPEIFSTGKCTEATFNQLHTSPQTLSCIAITTPCACTRDKAIDFVHFFITTHFASSGDLGCLSNM